MFVPSSTPIFADVGSYVTGSWGFFYPVIGLIVGFVIGILLIALIISLVAGGAKKLFGRGRAGGRGGRRRR